MKILYTNPTKEYQVREHESGLFFDEKQIEYYVCKYDESLAKLKGTSGYYIIHSFGTEKACYKWLKDFQIISKDEYKFLIKNL